MKVTCDWKTKPQSYTQGIIACPVCGQNGFAEKINTKQVTKLLVRVVHVASLEMDDNSPLEVIEACQIVSEARQAEIKEALKQ